jgi:hypothetical protein
MRLSKVGVAGLGIGVLAVVGASALPASAASGTQTFTLVSSYTGNGNPPSWLSASGPIHRLGIDFQLKSAPDGKSGTDKFAFHNGYVIVNHVSKHQSQSQDAGACLFRFTDTGTYTISTGSGAYAKAKGSGTYTVNFVGIGCNQNSNALVANETIVATGPLSF